MSFTIAKGMVRTAGKHYPAPITTVKTIEAAARLGRDDALKRKTRALSRWRTPTKPARWLNIFSSDQFVKGKAKQLTKALKRQNTRRYSAQALWGAASPLSVCWKGVPVVMKDINEKSLTLGMTEAAKLPIRQLERGKIDGLESLQA